MAEGRSRAGWTLALTSVPFFMVTLDSLVVVTALPAIHRELGGDLSMLEWTINTFTLAFAAGIITAAALGDRVGRRRVFLAGIALFTAASAACAVAPSAAFLVAARAVQGLGASMVLPLSLTLLTAAFPPARRGTVVGIWGGIGGLAVASGPLVGGAVTQGLDWHWIFWINVPIGLLAIVLSLLRLEESYGPPTRLDLVAVALVAGGSTALVWGLIHAGEAGWNDPAVIGVFVLGIVLVAGFVAWERRAPDPMLPLRLFGSKTFAAANTSGFLMSGSLFSAAFLVSQYMQFVLHYSPFDTGLRVLPWTATPLVVAPLAGTLSDRIGRRAVMACGLGLQAVGLFWFSVLASTSSTYGGFVLPLIVAGIGVSMALPMVPTTVMSSVSPQDMGKASGVNSTLQRFGSAFAVSIAAVVFAANGHLGTPAAFTAGFRPALAVAAGLSLLGAIVALTAAPRKQVAVEFQLQAPAA